MKKILMLSFITLCICMTMPWFTYNAKLRGYCRGIDFLKWMIIPLFIIGYSILSKKKHALKAILGIISAAVLLLETVISLGSWQYVRNIIGGFHWKDGFHTAQPFYWFILFTEFILFISLILNCKK